MSTKLFLCKYVFAIIGSCQLISYCIISGVMRLSMCMYCVLIILQLPNAE